MPRLDLTVYRVLCSCACVCVSPLIGTERQKTETLLPKDLESQFRTFYGSRGSGATSVQLEAEDALTIVLLDSRARGVGTHMKHMSKSLCLFLSSFSSHCVLRWRQRAIRVKTERHDSCLLSSSLISLPELETRLPKRCSLLVSETSFSTDLPQNRSLPPLLL